MSTTVTYKGNTITTVNNNTKTLTTAGKYLEANVILTDITGQGGNSGYTRTVIVPEQTVTPVYHSDGNTNGYSAQLNNTTEMFEQWSEYIVTFNGTEYYFTTILMWSNNYLMGEQAYLWRGTSETVYPYPFCVIATSINDNYIYTASTDSVTVKIEKIELTGSGSSTTSWENIYSNEINVSWEDWSDNPNNNCYYVMIPWTEPIDYGSVWRITWDGTPYECTATLAGSSDGTPYMLGNNTYNELEGGNNEPFMLQRYDSNLAIVSPDYGTHTILIEKQVTSSDATLITKTITANGTYSASDDNADGYSQVTVNLPVTWETKSDQGITITSDGTYNYAIWTYTEPLQANETYRITWGENGTQYVCQTVAESTGGTYDGYFLGNASIVNIGEDTGEPFLIYRNSNTRMIVTTTQSTGSWHVKVEKQVQISATLTTKTITENGTYIALNDSADGYSQVVVNVSNGSSTREIIIPEQTIEVSSNYTQLNYVSPLVEGEEYIYTINGSVYRGTAVSRYGSIDIGASSIGYIEYQNGMYFSIEDTSVEHGTYTIKVEKETSSGSSTPNLQTKTVTPTTSSQAISPDSGYDGLSSVTVNAIPSQYITTTDATATDSDIINGATAYVNGSKVTGSLVINKYYTGTTDPSASTGNDGDIYLKVVS